MCAIFSGRMCTSQNSTIAPIGTKTMMNHARYIAAESIISGGRNDAWALLAKTSATKASAGGATVARRAGRNTRNFIGNEPP